MEEEEEEEEEAEQQQQQQWAVLVTVTRADEIHRNSNAVNASTEWYMSAKIYYIPPSLINAVEIASNSAELLVVVPSKTCDLQSRCFLEGHAWSPRKPDQFSLSAQSCIKWSSP